MRTAKVKCSKGPANRAIPAASEAPTGPADARDDIRAQCSLRARRNKLEPRDEGLLRSERELEALRLRYASLFDAAPVGFVELDAKGTVLAVNVTAAHMLGRNRRSLVNTPFSAGILHPDRKVLDEHLRNVFNAPGKWSCELRLARREKTTMYIEVHSAVWGGPNSGTDGCLTGFVDITQRKRAVDGLRAGRDRLRMALAASRMGVWEWDLRTDALIWSPECYELFGVTGAIRTLRNAMDLLHPDDADRVLSAARAAISDKSDFRQEFRTVRPDGREVWLLGIGRAEYGDAGEPLRFTGTVRDITEQKLLQMEVAKQEQWLNSFFLGATTGLALLDRDMRYIKVNETLAEMNGVSSAEHIGRTVREVVPGVAGVVEPVFHQVIATGKPVLDIEIAGETPRRRGIRRHWLDSFFPVKGPDGTVQGAGATVFEITKLKQAEEEVRAYRDALQSLTTELSLMEERERHRIATDLHDQIGQTLAMANIRLGALDGAEDIRKLIEQAIAYTRSLTVELSPPVLYELGLAAGLSELAERFQSMHGIAIEVRDDEQPKSLDEDRLIALYKAVRELLMNVIKHARATQVVITLLKAGDCVRITVEDDGAGFDAGGIRPYPRTTGGFGLFSARERMRTIGGGLQIDSAPGQGTTVTIEAPLGVEGGEHDDTDPDRR